MAPGSVFLRAARIDPPMLVPLEELRPAAGAADPREDARTARLARGGRPSLPFSGFSLLALVLSGVAATSAGRRLQVAATPPPSAKPVVEPAGAPRVQAPAPVRRTPDRRTLLLAAGLLAVAALAAARAR